jgi:hypothetical protein
VGDPAEDGGAVPLTPQTFVGAVPVGAGLARDGITSEKLKNRGVRIAGKPAPTKAGSNMYAHVYPRHSSLQLVSLIPFDVSV